MLLGGAAFLGAVYFLITQEHEITSVAEKGQVLPWLAQQVPAASVLLIASMIGAVIGAWLLSNAMQAGDKTIPEEDRRLLEPLIAGGDEEGVNQYMRLSALTGGTGFFAKLGFTGLPLVTAALGLILICLAMFSSNPETSKELMDLAKLVLGAFIGSFVQRKVEQSNSGGPKRPEDAVL